MSTTTTLARFNVTLPDSRKDWTESQHFANLMAMELESTEDQLRTAIGRLIRDMEDATKMLDADRGLNGRGLVQGQGLDIDRLTSIREEKASALSRFASMAGLVTV